VAKQSTTTAINFLGWLTDRSQVLGGCSQHVWRRLKLAEQLDKPGTVRRLRALPD
jgi:hypothetical protein